MKKGQTHKTVGVRWAAHSLTEWHQLLTNEKLGVFIRDNRVKGQELGSVEGIYMGAVSGWKHSGGRSCC